MVPSRARPLWTCPRCGHRFVSPNLTHSCGRFRLDDHFRGKDPNLRRAFRRLASLSRRLGPVTVYAQKTRIVFMVRVRFASVVVRKRSSDFGLWLTRTVDHPRRFRTEVLGRRIFYTHFRLSSPEEVDGSLAALLRVAYAIGRQAHLPP